ncbi:MAG: hypothetical protein F4227_07470 [Gammaproteobacteria bacterium]|nr:hypothetical protein [Gammaproteobacteria bacterium]MYF02791.1 hypothetical protein [Gammaproteobacteria bacterium]
MQKRITNNRSMEVVLCVGLLLALLFLSFLLFKKTSTLLATEPSDPNGGSVIPNAFTTITGAELQFTKITDIGLNRTYPHEMESLSDKQFYSAGIASGDIDDDGDVDLYVVGGNEVPNALYLNNGNGTFVDVAEEYGVGLLHWGSGPAFGDIDGDGDLDLFVSAMEFEPVKMFANDSEAEKFVDITEEAGIVVSSETTVSATMADYDRDGWIDIFLSHWGEKREFIPETETLWRNEGNGLFRNVSKELGVSGNLLVYPTEYTFTANVFDIDNDSDTDLLMVADFGTTQLLLNNDGNNFFGATDRTVIKDQNGMGTAVGDFDNDGDFDWFVTSIYNANLGGEFFGNRLYQNNGHGVFSDITDQAHVASGAWGWAACTKDFDQDGFLDIFHVNGWREEQYRDTPSRLFWNRLDGTFRQIAAHVGIDDTEQGRGVVCFDADRDGDIDILVVNASEPHLVFYRNDSVGLGNYLVIKLRGSGDNTYGVGSIVKVTTEFGTQMRQLGGSNNFVSHNPLEVHFGLGTATRADVRVEWFDENDAVTRFSLLEVNKVITVSQPGVTGLRLSVRFGDGDGRYNAGEVVAIEAEEPQEGYYFSHWTVSGGSVADKYSASTNFAMPSSVATVTAHYVPGVAPSANVSIARRWNEVLLSAIRNDYARPTVHARNLFHISAAQYDAWAGMVKDADPMPKPWLLGSSEVISCPLEDINSSFTEADIEVALSYASFRLIRHRFARSPGLSQIVKDSNALMSYLELDPDDTDADYADGSPIALGNYISSCYIAFGQADYANEYDDYKNKSYLPVNPALEPHMPGNPNIVDLNRWQPLALENFIDQAGNNANSEPEFLSPEWGSVLPFALSPDDVTIYTRDGEDYEYQVYHDPGGPPTIDGALADEYKWSHSFVAVWSSHLDPTVGRGAELIDISPNGIGNIAVDQYPRDFPGHRSFFQDNGLDPGQGYRANPTTGEPYEPQMVPLGDYTRVLAEFWADGPDSETPPGHWFVILNEVNDHPLSTRKVRGVGEDRPELEWDVISYFVLGGTMHDAAIAAWGVKGWYDYIRPISSIRAMADLGQSSDDELPSYHENGIPLKPGYIELIDADDPLAGANDENVGKIKLLAWRGPDYIIDPTTDVAGVDWILAENWWPYQRPTFVTPPFAGYVSGHSTYSRAAAEVMTALTGDEYFPGGMSDFEAPQDDFLVFEKGPSVSLTLQWATYRDASDQCSLSRIWGGIHPPADDIPGRLIGIKVGEKAFEHAMKFVEPTVADEEVASP